MCLIVKWCEGIFKFSARCWLEAITSKTPKIINIKKLVNNNLSIVHHQRAIFDLSERAISIEKRLQEVGN